jgi:hypothetical protein
MPEERDKKKKRPETSRLRRLIKLVGWFFLVMFLLVIMVTVAARYYFNSDKLAQIAVHAVEKTLPRKLQLGALSFNLFSGFELRDVQLFPQNDSPDLFPLRRLSFKKITLNYSLSDLLKRKLIIREVVLEQPDFELFVDMVDTTTIDFAALLATDLPITFDLKTLRCTDAKIRVVLADSQYSQTYYIGQMNFFIDNMVLPKKGWAANDSLLRGTFRLNCENTAFKVDYLDKPTHERILFDSKIDLDTRIRVNSFRHIQLNTVLQLAQSQLDFASRHYQISSAFTLGLQAAIDARLGACRLETFLDIDHNRWLAANVQLDSLMRQPRLLLEVIKGEIPLQQLMTLAEEVVPDSLMTISLASKISSSFSFDGSYVRGTLPFGKLPGDLDFKVTGRLSKTDLLDRNKAWMVQGAALAIMAEGRTDGLMLHNLSVSGTAGLDSLTYALNDSQSVYAGTGRLFFSTRLNERLLPEKTRLSFSIMNFLGGQVNGDLDLQGSRNLMQLHGQGQLALNNLPLKKIPNVSVDGDLTVTSRFSIQTLQNIRADLLVATTSMRMAGETEPIPLPAILLKGYTLGRTDTTFTQVVLDSISLQLNNVLEAQAAGRIGLRDRTFEMTPCSLILDHAALLELVPAVFREKFRDLQTTGQTQIQLDAGGAMAAAGLTYNIQGILNSRNTSVYDPERLLSFGGIHLHSRFKMNSKSGVEASVSLTLDSLSTTGYGMPTYLNNQFDLEAVSKDMQQFEIKKGHLAMPDVKTVLDFDAIVNGKNVQAGVYMHQDIPDSFLVRDVLLKGRTDLSLSIHADTAFVDIAADIKATHLCISMPGLVSVRNLDADIYAHQRYNLKAGELLSSQAFKIATPTNAFIDYLLYSDYYRGHQPHLSRISIQEMDVMGYVLKEINLELLLDEGRLEIPSISAMLLGGNVGGRMTMDLAAGNPAAASYKMNAHFANINSSLLTRYMAIPKDDGAINGNLEFRGLGLDPEKHIVLDGYFYITKIGPKAADNLLTYLDPEAKDSGISTSRMLIRNGFKPRLLSFDFRNLHLYPVIEFAKPWYLPRGLDRIELNRIPLQFFFDRMKARADWQVTAN